MLTTLPKTRVAVLLATCNGGPWLPDQVTSILGQEGVEVEVWVSDDGSRDGSWEWLQRLAGEDERIRLLPRIQPSGSPGRNFYRLLRDADWTAANYVAFSDQDDVWLPWKLSTHARVLASTGADGLSSNVLAFWPDGRQVLIDKAQAQREFDYLFESPGPGCTFLMTPWLATTLRTTLSSEYVGATVELHDWLAYAVCRASGRSWFISPEPSVRYRQHAGNAFGANAGLARLVARLNQVRGLWYRDQCAAVCRASLAVAQPSIQQHLRVIAQALEGRNLRARARLFRWASLFRRRFRDRLLLRALIVTGVF